jgi:uncharacterized protein (TIGR00369 family)
MGCPLLDQLTDRSYDEDGIHYVELDIIDAIRSPAGTVHGGVIASLADRAGAYSVVLASGRSVVTSNLSLSYLAAAAVGPLRAAATNLRIGRRQGVVEVRVYDTGKMNCLVATALLTMIYLPDEVAEAATPSL